MLLLALPLFPLSSHIVFADATVHTSVTTSGNATVSTHIETSVNGQKEVLDSATPGTYTLDVKSNGSATPVVTVIPSGITVQTNSSDEVTTTPASVPATQPTYIPVKIYREKILSLFSSLQQFFAQLHWFFHF